MWNKGGTIVHMQSHKLFFDGKIKLLNNYILPGLSLHTKLPGFFTHSPLPATSVHVLVLTSGGNSPSSQWKVTSEPSEKGGVPPLMSTLPLDGAAGEPQVTGGSNA